MAPTALGLRSNGGPGSAGAQWNRRNDSVELPDGKNRDLLSPASRGLRHNPNHATVLSSETNQSCHLALRQWQWGWQQGTMKKADITNRPPSPPSLQPASQKAGIQHTPISGLQSWFAECHACSHARAKPRHPCDESSRKTRANRPILFDSPSCTPMRANMNCGRCSGSCIPMLQLLWRLRFLSVGAAAFRCVTAALAASFHCVTAALAALTAALAAAPRCFECLTAALTAASRCITACRSQPGLDIHPWYIGGPDLSCPAANLPANLLP